MTLWTAGFLPLLAPSSLLLLVVPSYAMGLAQEAQRELFYYYSYPFLPFLWMGAAWGWARLLRRFRRGWLPISVAVVVAGAYMVTLPTRTDGFRRVAPPVTERHRWIRQQLRERIPFDASLAAQFDLLCQAPYRTAIYPLSEGNIGRARYWAIDLKGHYGDVSGRQMERILDRARELAREKRATIVVNRDGFLILRQESVASGAISGPKP